LQSARKRPDPQLGQLEAVLGPDGAKTWRWYKTGLERATAVCSIRAKLGGRVGTGWLVRADSLGRIPGEGLLMMTNFHVINAQGADKGITPDAAEIVFEAADDTRIYLVKDIVWSSPPDRHDCTLVRLSEPVPIIPLPLAKSLPLVEDTARVYIIG